LLVLLLVLVLVLLVLVLLVLVLLLLWLLRRRPHHLRGSKPATSTRCCLVHLLHSGCHGQGGGGCPLFTRQGDPPVAEGSRGGDCCCRHHAQLVLIRQHEHGLRGVDWQLTAVSPMRLLLLGLGLQGLVLLLLLSTRKCRQHEPDSPRAAFCWSRAILVLCNTVTGRRAATWSSGRRHLAGK
jgi:hypothetical protein